MGTVVPTVPRDAFFLGPWGRGGRRGDQEGTLTPAAGLRGAFFKDMHGLSAGPEGQTGLCGGTVQTEGPAFRTLCKYSRVRAGGGRGRRIWRGRCAAQQPQTASVHEPDRCLWS